MDKMKSLKHWGWPGSHLELLFWLTALATLGFTASNEQVREAHFTLCPLANMGLEGCPGCGIGRSIGNALNGQFKQSFDYHWFGIPALLIITYRISVLSVLVWKNTRLKNIKE